MARLSMAVYSFWAPSDPFTKPNRGLSLGMVLGDCDVHDSSCDVSRKSNDRLVPS